MISLLFPFVPFAALLSATSPARKDRTWIECQLVGASEMSLTPRARLYTGRHDRRFAAAGRLFLDLRYDGIAHTVAVTVVEAPHAPWSFGETVIRPERMLDVSRRDPETRTIAMDVVHPGARLACGQG